jgi:hypothetical protein
VPRGHVLAEHVVEREPADGGQHRQDDDGEERRVRAVAARRLAVAAGPVPGDGEEQRADPDRPHVRDVEHEAADEARDGAGHRAAQEGDPEQRDEQHVRRAAEHLERREDRRLQQRGDHDHPADRQRVTHGPAASGVFGIKTSTECSDDRSTYGSICTCW